MSDIIIAVISFLASWLLAKSYYLRGKKEIPDWAIPLIEKLPKQRPSLFELLGLFQEALDDGRASIHPVANIVACPECGAPSQDFKESVFGDDNVTIVSIQCPGCGWSKSFET